MRYVSALVALSFIGASNPAPLQPVRQQRYSMGTMFDIVAWHSSASSTERAVDAAMGEILRLEQVMSHYRDDSELARLVREARVGVAVAEPSLFQVIDTALAISRESGGVFDITVAPLVKVWKRAHDEGRRPSAGDLASARSCVGHEKVHVLPPDRIRFTSSCVELDLGGIGKGYAVDRALAALRAAGIEHASVNAGGSSIGAMGTPPGQDGWAVDVGRIEGRAVTLRNASISTSQQVPDRSAFGEIIDMRSAAPTASTAIVSVVAPSATVSDALSTTLLLMQMDRGKALLARFPDVSAVWLTASGERLGSHGSIFR